MGSPEPDRSTPRFQAWKVREFLTTAFALVMALLLVWGIGEYLLYPMAVLTLGFLVAMLMHFATEASGPR